MQNAIGVHPSWAELGYDSIVACREHLERCTLLTDVWTFAVYEKMLCLYALCRLDGNSPTHSIATMPRT